jgi:parvulin-like peptidyl-prolyl isomerase
MIPQIGYERAIAAAAFKLSKKNKLSRQPLKGNKGYYIIRLKERKQADTKEFDEEKTEIRRKLLQQKKSNTFSTYLVELRKRSNIAVQDKFAQ